MPNPLLIAGAIIGAGISVYGGVESYRQSKAAQRARDTQSAIDQVNVHTEAFIANINAQQSYEQGLANAYIAGLNGKASGASMTQLYNQSMANSMVMAVAQGRSGESVQGFARASEHQYNWDKDFGDLSTKVEMLGQEAAGRAGQAQLQLQGMQSLMSWNPNLQQRSSQADTLGAFGKGMEIGGSILQFGGAIVQGVSMAKSAMDSSKSKSGGINSGSKGGSSKGGASSGATSGSTGGAK